MRLRLTVGLVMSVGVLAACGHRHSRSPEQLRDAHVAALEADDPAAAYALLSPEARAETDFEEFSARWKSDRAEHEAAVAAAKALPSELTAPVHGGSTVHPGGRVLRWTEVEGELLVAEGLPGRPDTSTPAQVIRAFIAAVRTAQLYEIRVLLAEPLVEAIAEDWIARVDAIEEALAEPGAIDLSADLRRAELRYEPGRVLTLEQTREGWRIIDLE